MYFSSRGFPDSQLLLCGLAFAVGAVYPRIFGKRVAESGLHSPFESLILTPCEIFLKFLVDL